MFIFVSEWGALVSISLASLSLGHQPLGAQEAAPQEPPASGSGAQAPENNNTEERLKNLRTRSLQSDIATATFYELEIMAKELGVAVTHDVESLRNALYRRLNIPVPESRSGAGSDGNMVIRIESAQRAQVFNLETSSGEEEDYFQISGGVKITIRDEQEGYEHKVVSDKIIFNRKQNTIRAEGTVIYEKRKISTQNTNDEKDIERFLGDSLIFRIGAWRGVIFYGVFSRNQTIPTERPDDVNSSSSNPEKTRTDSTTPLSNTDINASILGKTVLYDHNVAIYFDGEKIRKGDDDILVMEKGKISTSNADEPYYSLKFNRLWIFGKPEWAMLSATLFVGHIPILWLPYYYHNDSQLLFHPVFGIREAYGEFIQTTTYFLGKPEAKSNDSFSFIPVNQGTEGDNIDYDLNALYLVAKEQEGTQSTQKKSRDYLKLMLDYYSYIGLFTGLQGIIADTPFINEWNFLASAAYYYALEERTGAGYATGRPFILGSNGTYRLVPIHTYFLGLEIPLRYGLDTQLKSKNNIFHIDFKMYSDPFYRRDFLNRQENFDWISYILARIQQPEGTDGLSELRKKESVLTTYKWELGLDFRPQLDISFIDSLSVSAYVAAYWAKRNDETKEGYDPTREFFYPNQFYLPDTTVRLSGTIWPPNSKTSRASSTTSPLLKDWQREDEGDGEPSPSQPPPPEEASELQKPLNLEKISNENQADQFSFSTKYNASFQNLFLTQTKNSNWKQAADVLLNNDEMKYTGNENLEFINEWGIIDQLLKITLKHKFSLQLAHYFDIIENNNNSNDLVATKQGNQFNWVEESQIVIKPLYTVDWFRDTSLTHNIQATFFNYAYSTPLTAFQSTWLDFTTDKETIREKFTEHRLTSVLDFHPIRDKSNPANDLHASITIDNYLPPRTPENKITPMLAFEFFRWRNEVSIEFKQSGEADPNFYAQPLTFTSIYRPISDVEIKNVLVYNFEAENKEKEPHFDQEEFSFRLWWFSGGLNLRYTQPYRWDQVNFTWVSDGEERFTLYNTWLGFRLTTADHYLWKNRILYYFSLGSEWRQDLVRYNEESSFTLDFTFSFFIHEFLNIQISYRMSNEKLYLYYPGAKDYFNFSQTRYIMEDLLNSISFWDEEKLKKGLFKMKDIRILAIHHLKDWDLIFEYVGQPKQINNALSWESALGFYLRWVPIPLIKRRAIYENREWTSTAR